MLSLRRANASAKEAWNDPRWQRERKQAAPQPVDEELNVSQFKPIVDEEGSVWRRTLNAPPPWRR